MIILNTENKSSIAKAVLSGVKEAPKLTDFAGLNVIFLDQEMLRIEILYSYPQLGGSDVNTYYTEKWLTFMDRNSLPNIRQQIKSFSEFYTSDFTGIALYKPGEIMDNLNPFVAIVFIENGKIRFDFVVLLMLIDFWKNNRDRVEIKNKNISILNPYHKWIKRNYNFNSWGKRVE